MCVCVSSCVCAIIWLRMYNACDFDRFAVHARVSLRKINIATHDGVKQYRLSARAAVAVKRNIAMAQLRYIKVNRLITTGMIK